MKDIKIIAGFLLFALFLGCKKRTEYQVRFSKDLYKPLFFKSKCQHLFDQDTIPINLDTFQINNFSSFKHPIYKFCDDNQDLLRFFSSIKENRLPFHLGYLDSVKNKSLDLFSVNSYQPNRRFYGSVSGYFSFKTADGFLIFKGFESNVDSPVTFEAFFRKDYLLLWAETDESYDIADNSKSKTIRVRYCLLKILANKNIFLVSQKKSIDLLKNNFFGRITNSKTLNFN